MQAKLLDVLGWPVCRSALAFGTTMAPGDLGAQSRKGLRLREVGDQLPGCSRHPSAGDGGRRLPRKHA